MKNLLYVGNHNCCLRHTLTSVSFVNSMQCTNEKNEAALFFHFVLKGMCVRKRTKNIENFYAVSLFVFYYIETNKIAQLTNFSPESLTKCIRELYIPMSIFYLSTDSLNFKCNYDKNQFCFVL